MTEYLKTIVAVLLGMGLCLSVVPQEGEGKSVRFAVGILALYVLLSPILSATDWKAPVQEISAETLEIKQCTYVKDAFETELAGRVENAFFTETGDRIDVTVCAETEQDQVTGVEKIIISPYSDAAAEYIGKYVGIQKDKVVAKVWEN